ncbi:MULTISPECIES: hypothetical protein [Streptomyces]|uniref:DhaL domain-containing protein n=1 Tax=Streptomyces spororaveus TaxID=284039 RepID=A0ABQ3TG26_9ACTN|nr:MULTISPECIES: hypothetical protein [Streptomyces]MCM9080672.1 hypothetical protein [Streptomyces spororaveus]MCX5304899.1 hypothetical protein [Streptomyces sp. NBC_00160]GHI78977.1 hypothetical protein Sspor_45380 [Streptomyces spororaveus]
MSGDGADVDVSKQALGQMAKDITDTLGELKELGTVGSGGMGRGFSYLALSGRGSGIDALTASVVRNQKCSR